MIELLFVRQAAVILASGVAAYTDHKTGFIYDYITMPLIAIGALLNIVEQEWNAFIIAGIVFAIGYALYYTGKLGGGDVKLYSGIALAMPFYGGGVFMLPALVIGALGAVVALSTYYVAAYARKGIDWEYNKTGAMRTMFLGVILAAYFYILSTTGFVGSDYVILLGTPMLFGLAFMALEKGIRKEFFLKKVKPHELEEDEVIAIDFLSEKEKKRMGLGFKGVIGKDDADRLENAGVKEVPVYRNLPRFGIFIFIGVVLAIAFPEFGTLLGGGFM